MPDPLADESDRPSTEPTSPSAGPAEVYQFHDYRQFLKEITQTLTDVTRPFSHRKFARMAGFGSPTYLQMIIQGKRNLSPVSASKCARALHLSKRETDYFETLVLYNQAKTDSDRDRYLSQLAAMRPASKMADINKDQYEYFTQTHFVIIREMAALPGFEDNPEWIASHLSHRVTTSEIKHALEVLERLTLLVRDENGRLKHSGTTLQTPLNAPSIELLNYHRQVLAQTKEAILTLPHNQWDVASLTIPIPEETLPKVMAVLHRAREEIAEVVNKGSKDYREVYQVNMQMFPVTKMRGE